MFELLLIMPRVSRALRNRAYGQARESLLLVIPDKDDVSRALASLIETEPAPFPGLASRKGQNGPRG